MIGMTETSTVVSSTSEHDVFPGSSGSLLPGVRAKIIGFDGKEVDGYEQPGELVMQSPSVVLGYLNHEKANAETFVWDDEGRWIKTGDEAMVKKAPSGNEHVFILDRIKELIKVKVSASEIMPKRRVPRRLATCSLPGTNLSPRLPNLAPHPSNDLESQGC